MVKNLPVNAGNIIDPRSIPQLGKYPGGRNATPYSFLEWRILWTEETGELQSIGSQRVGHN